MVERIDTSALTDDQMRRLVAAQSAAIMLRGGGLALNAKPPKTSQIIDLADWILFGNLEVDEEQEAHGLLMIESGD